MSVTGSDGTVLALYGSNPSYVDLMQRSFNRAEEKALLASLSYDFSGLGIEGLTVIANFVAGFDGVFLGERGDAQELAVTLDYRVGKGLFESLWLRMRGSWLHDDLAVRNGTDVRVILRYDFPII